VAIRYPRGRGVGVPMDENYREIPIGEAEFLRDGSDLLIFALGSMVKPSLDAAELLGKEGLSVGVVNGRFVKPLDKRLAEVAGQAGRVLTVEENIRQGGFGSAVLELLNEMDIRDVLVRRVGLPDKFIEHGPAPFLRKKYGLDQTGILKEARDLCRQSKTE